MARRVDAAEAAFWSSLSPEVRASIPSAILPPDAAAKRARQLGAATKAQRDRARDERDAERLRDRQRKAAARLPAGTYADDAGLLVMRAEKTGAALLRSEPVVELTPTDIDVAGRVRRFLDERIFDAVEALEVADPRSVATQPPAVWRPAEPPRPTRVLRSELELVYRAFEAVFGMPALVAWQRTLRLFVREALRFRRAKRARRPERMSTTGAHVLLSVRRVSPTGTVPAALTADAIEAVLRTATLTRGARGFTNYQRALDKLIRRVTGKKPHRFSAE